MVLRDGERAVTGWAESPIDYAIASAEDGLMAMMGPAGILLFTRPRQLPRPETRAQERQRRNRPRIDAVIRTFRRRSHANETKSPAIAATSPGQAVGRVDMQGRAR